MVCERRHGHRLKRELLLLLLCLEQEFRGMNWTHAASLLRGNVDFILACFRCEPNSSHIKYDIISVLRFDQWPHLDEE